MGSNKVTSLTLLQSEWPKLYGALAILRAQGFTKGGNYGDTHTRFLRLVCEKKKTTTKNIQQNNTRLI